MSRSLVLVGAGLLLSACASTRAQPPTAGAVAAGAAPRALWGAGPGDRAKGPLLFVVEGAAGAVYLFGTMHTESVASMPKVAVDHFAQARTVAFEADIENLEPMKLVLRGMLPPDQSLEQLVGPEVWRRLQENLAGTIPPQVLTRFRPWLACVLLIQKSMGVPPGAEVMDLALLKRSRTESKTVKFLETMDQQVEALEKMMDKAMLIELARDLDKLPPLFASLTDAYRAGDIAAIEVVNQLAANSGANAARMRELLGARNERWIPFVEQLVSGGGGFIAFGAAHLPGEDGVVALLRRRGHKVTRVLAPGAPN